MMDNTADLGRAMELAAMCDRIKELEAKTVVVGSPEHREARKKKIGLRIDQAIKEISDETVFSPDQIAKLTNVIILLKWALEEAS
jgi:phosphotransacetylase